MPNKLQDFKDFTARSAFGMTKVDAHKQGVCISCKEKPRFRTQAGIREYGISGLCEYCWDEMFKENDND